MTQQSHSCATSGENHTLKRYKCPKVHRSTVYGSQDMEATEGGIDKEDRVQNTVEYYSVIKKNEIMPLTAT